MFTLKNNQDLHAALKTEIVAGGDGGGVEFKLVRLQNSKNDVRFSLHGNPGSFSSSGIQTTDYLSYLGFNRGICTFTSSGQCYSRQVAEGFDLEKFAVAFANSFANLEEARRHLDACAFILDQPEGWGYFYGKPSGTQLHENISSLSYGAGDGHTAPSNDVRGTSEDDYFLYKLTYKGDRAVANKGWTFHYRPKHPPASMEIQAALKFLGLKTFDQCPQFDFQSCFWRFIRFEADKNDPFPQIIQYVIEGFGSHPIHFSKGIEKLLTAQSLMVPFGMFFLAFERVASIPIEIKTTQPQAPSGQPTIIKKKFEYDVALSFAGTEREIAEKLATIVRNKGFNVFYDKFYEEDLWGKNLVEYFDNIYRKWSRYAVMIISSEYVNRIWTIQERRSILSRMLEEKGGVYVLPIRVDDTEVPGLQPTIGYLKYQDYSIDKLGDILVNKLKSNV